MKEGPTRHSANGSLLQWGVRCAGRLRPKFGGRALFRIIKLRINFRICYLRRIKLALEKINFVNISYLLFPISFRPPRRLSPWRPSPPFRGRAVGYGSLFRDLSEEPPSPFYEWPSPTRGRAVPFSKFIEKVNFVDISYFLFLFDPLAASVPGGPLPLSGGVRSATGVYLGI